MSKEFTHEEIQDMISENNAGRRPRPGSIGSILAQLEGMLSKKSETGPDVNVIVSIYQGCIQDVDVLDSEEAAKARFEKYAEMTYEEYQAIAEDTDEDLIDTVVKWYVTKIEGVES